MEFNIKHRHQYTDVSISDGNSTLDIGLLDGPEREEMALTLLAALDTLINRDFLCHHDYVEWVLEKIK